MSKRILAAALLSAAALAAGGCRTQEPREVPGKGPDGRVLLPDGWYLSPAGRAVAVGDLPLSMDLSPDGRFAVVANAGYDTQSISVVDVSRLQVVQTVPVAKTWLGLKLFDGGRQIALSGGNDNRILLYRFDEGRAMLADSIVLGKPWPEEKIWVAGLDVDEPSSGLYAVGRQDRSIVMIDLTTRKVVRRLSLAGVPYTCLVSTKHDIVYVSIWGRAEILRLRKGSLALVDSIRTGEHPTDMVESPDGGRLFVANANENTVSVVDLAEGRTAETISSALYPGSPPGSTPNSLALNREGTRLFIANADINAVAVCDVSRAGASRRLGYIPVGWYPTSVRVMGDKLFVLNAKGDSSRANPNGPKPYHRHEREQYIGSMFHGSLSAMEIPDSLQLAALTREVYDNSLYRGPEVARTIDANNPVPDTPGGTSPIKHVFYIIKENRTYDQVFGDVASGNGDSTLCLFGEGITPNHHAIAERFVLLDNLYADAEVSADGHSWSMGAYADDYIEKSWPTQYSDRGGDYDYEGDNPIAIPPGGYIWDDCRTHGISYRSYGEFVFNGKTAAETMKAVMPSLEGHVAPWFAGWDLDISDLDRVAAWKKEFEAYERSGDLPQFQVIRLPNDHTYGTARDKLSPRAYVAQNDLALGLVVEEIAQSRFWSESAVFVIEDDAQNGADHVDAHRTVALVASPYAKRGFVDSRLYSTSSLLRTMELILGLPPMTQFDAAAAALWNSFQATPDMSPYTHKAARYNIDEINADGSYGQLESEGMDFTREDGAPEARLNEIIWRSVRGAAIPLPPVVRGRFLGQ